MVQTAPETCIAIRKGSKLSRLLARLPLTWPRTAHLYLRQLRTCLDVLVCGRDVFQGGRSVEIPFHAVDKHGVVIDFMLLYRRSSSAAHRFLKKALTTMRRWPPSSITADQLGSYPKAIERLKREGTLGSDTRHRTYLNNIVKADHGVLKQVIRPTRGFQTMKTATETIKGFEIMRMIRRGQCLTCKRGVSNEIRFVNQLFNIAA